jgi:four helix bundle protein
VHSREGTTQEQFAGLRERAFAFAVATVRFCRELRATWEGRQIGDRLFRAATAVGANYQAAGRARSDREFIAKLGTVVEEADESCYWLRLLAATEVHRGPEISPLLRESTELLKIFSASLRTARTNRKQRKAQSKR